MEREKDRGGGGEGFDEKEAMKGTYIYLDHYAFGPL